MKTHLELVGQLQKDSEKKHGKFTFTVKHHYHEGVFDFSIAHIKTNSMFVDVTDVKMKDLRITNDDGDLGIIFTVDHKRA